MSQMSSRARASDVVVVEEEDEEEGEEKEEEGGRGLGWWEDGEMLYEQGMAGELLGLSYGW